MGGWGKKVLLNSVMGTEALNTRRSFRQQTVSSIPVAAGNETYPKNVEYFFNKSRVSGQRGSVITTVLS